MRKTLKDKLNNKKGFTLAETLIAVAITGILLALSMIAILQYSKDIKLTEMDQTAKAIFVAAQNHLSAADANGSVDRYADKKQTPDSNIGTLIVEKPSDVPDGIKWPDKNNEYYCIDHRTESENGSLTKSILKYMLPFGAVDEDVRTDGNYIVEYDVKTGAVYGVFYSEDRFGYTDVTTLDKDGGREDSEKGRRARKNYDGGIIGYYGGAMAGKLLAADMAQPTVEIINEDTLRVKITDTNYFKKATDNKTPLKTYITLFVKGNESGKELRLTLDTAEVAGRVSKKNPTKETWWTVTQTGAAGSESTLVYDVTLDDITKAGGHFADICKELIPGEDITVKTVCASKAAIASVKETENVTNSLFASILVTNDEFEVAVNGGGVTASVAYIRHIENLDPEISALPQHTGTVGKKKIKNVVNKVVQTADMNWEDFFNTTGGKKTSKSIYPAGLDETFTMNYLTESGYYGISNEAVAAYDGRGKSIDNVVIDGADRGGLFREIPEGGNITIKDLNLNNFYVSATTKAGALIGSVNTGAKAAVSYVSVKDSEITATGERGVAGSLIGGIYASNFTTADVSYCGAYATSKEAYSGKEAFVSSESAAGGLIGEIGAYKCRVENSFAAVSVQSAGTAAGGFIGMISGSDVSISKSYSGGYTVGDSYSKTEYNINGSKTGSAGGFAGKVSVSGVNFNNCYSTCSVKGAASGGFVGAETDYASNNGYNNCYSTGLASGEQAGAFAGRFKGSRGDSYYLKGINTAAAFGDGYTSGNFETVSYTDMQKNQNVETHGYGKYGKAYPFAGVTWAMAGDLTYAYAHYGDWPEMQQTVKGSIMAYRETVDGQDYWYMVGAEGRELTVYDGLLTDKGKTATNPVYGILLDPNGKNLQSQFTGNPRNYLQDAGQVTVNGTTYDFYTVKANAIDRDGNGISDLSRWKDCPVDFCFNIDFAASIATDRTDLGTATSPYKVRTDGQLRNIAKADIYSGKHFIQTLDISLTDANFAAFGSDSFTGSYDASYIGGGQKSYSITNFKQTGGNPGLITDVGPSGVVKNVDISGDMGFNDPDVIGSLAGSVSGGSIIQCRSHVNISAATGGTDMSLGGLIGSVSSGSTVEKCGYDGQLLLNVRGEGCDIGGLIGFNAGRVTDSNASSAVRGMVKGSNNRVGGLTGANVNKGLIERCWSKPVFSGMMFTGTAGENYLGGLTGRLGGGASVYDSYTVADFTGVKTNIPKGLLAGINTYSTEGNGILRNNHAVQTTDKAVKLSDYNFVNETAQVDNKKSCFTFSDPQTGYNTSGITFINDADKYKDINTYLTTGWDSSIWEIKNGGKYPTLIENPEN